MCDRRLREDALRFIDRIIDEWRRQGDGTLGDSLRAAVKFRLQNVADHVQQTRESRAPADFGFIVPPWRSFYGEWKWKAEAGRELAVACLVNTFGQNSLIEGQHIRWSIQESHFFDFGDHIDQVVVLSMLDEDGAFVPLNWNEAGAALLADVPRSGTGKQLFCRMFYPHCGGSHDADALFRLNSLAECIIYYAIAACREGCAEVAATADLNRSSRHFSSAFFL